MQKLECSTLNRISILHTHTQRERERGRESTQGPLWKRELEEVEFAENSICWT